MANTHGGYVLLGLDEVNKNGRRFRVVGCPTEHLVHLDYTIVVAKFARYVEQNLGLQIQVHNLKQFAANDGPPWWDYLERLDRQDVQDLAPIARSRRSISTSNIWSPR
jgi:hypothetical protein